jgi:hypothetical protein
MKDWQGAVNFNVSLKIPIETKLSAEQWEALCDGIAKVKAIEEEVATRDSHEG